jgi:hypothetical protein
MPISVFSFQINELMSRLEREGILKKEKEKDRLIDIPRLPPKRKRKIG